MSAMKLLIGLGNPGKQYSKNRHNVGFMAIDYLQQNKISNLVLKKSDKFMNNSGESVAKFTSYYSLSPDALFVAHDDLDLPLGEYKIQKGKGPKLHGGILSIEERLATADFWRVRIGVDNRDKDNRISGEEYVLQNFSKDELESLHTVFEKIANELNSDD